MTLAWLHSYLVVFIACARALAIWQDEYNLRLYSMTWDNGSAACGPIIGGLVPPASSTAVKLQALTTWLRNWSSRARNGRLLTAYLTTSNLQRMELRKRILSVYIVSYVEFYWRRLLCLRWHLIHSKTTHSCHSIGQIDSSIIPPNLLENFESFWICFSARLSYPPQCDTFPDCIRFLSRIEALFTTLSGLKSWIRLQGNCLIPA